MKVYFSFIWSTNEVVFIVLSRSGFSEAYIGETILVKLVLGHTGKAVWSLMRLPVGNQ